MIFDPIWNVLSFLSPNLNSLRFKIFRSNSNFVMKITIFILKLHFDPLWSSVKWQKMTSEKCCRFKLRFGRLKIAQMILKNAIFVQKRREIDFSARNQLWFEPKTVKNDLEWPLMTQQNLKILIGSWNVTVNISKILTPGVGILNKRVLSWTNVKKNFQIVNCNWPRTNHSWPQSKQKWPWNRQKIQN